jgi:hypothetical protein
MNPLGNLLKGNACHIPVAVVPIAKQRCRDEIAGRRIDHAYKATLVSRRLVMFQVYFLNNVNCISGGTLPFAFGKTKH